MFMMDLVLTVSIASDATIRVRTLCEGDDSEVESFRSTLALCCPCIRPSTSGGELDLPSLLSLRACTLAARSLCEILREDSWMQWSGCSAPLSSSRQGRIDPHCASIVRDHKVGYFLAVFICFGYVGRAMQEKAFREG